MNPDLTISLNLPLLRFLLGLSDMSLRLALVVLVLSVCFAFYYLFQLIFRKYLFNRDHSSYAGYIYNAMGVVFSLVFAFITVLVWQNYNGVNDAVTKEASNLNNIYRLYSAFPPEIDTAGKAAIRDYTHSIIEEDWPLLSKDQFNIASYQKFLKIESEIIRYQPKTAGEINAHQQMLRLITDSAELRRSRVYNAKFALDPPAWVGLVSSALVFLFFSCLFEMKSREIHLLLILFLGLTIVGVLYFLVLYIHPFLGPMAIQPTPFQNLLNITWATP